MNKYVAYHRTSTKDQHLDRGIAEIMKYCKDNEIPLYKNKVYTVNVNEKVSQALMKK